MNCLTTSKRILFKSTTIVRERRECRRPRMFELPPFRFSRANPAEHCQADQYHQPLGEEVAEPRRTKRWATLVLVIERLGARVERFADASDSDEQTNRTDTPTGTPVVVLVPEKSAGKRLAREPDEISYRSATSKNSGRKCSLEFPSAFETHAPQIFLYRLFNHLRVASRLPPSCDYMMFKSSILPCWEDPQNSSGGRWVLYFSKPEQVYLNLDVCWLASVSSPMAHSHTHISLRQSPFRCSL